MSDVVVNLNQERKKRAKVMESERAALNRAHHGRGKAEKRLAATQAARAAQRLDDHRLAAEAPDDGAGGR